MKSYFGRFIPLLFFIALGITIANALIFFSSLHDLIDDEQWVNHSHEVITEVEGAFSSLKEAESAERGYIITDDEKYLAPFNSTIELANYHLQRVKVLTADNANQQENIKNLEKTITQRITLLKQGINDQQMNGFASAQTLLASSQGFQIMQQIKNIIVTMEKKEAMLLKTRALLARVSIQEMYTTITLSMLINLLLIFIAFFFIRREFFQRTASEERKNDFISIASHELKTPITSMSVFADLLQKRIVTFKDKQAKHYITKIREQIIKQNVLISDLLDISKMQAGKIELQREVFDINKLVRETVEVMQATTKTHKIIIKGRIRGKAIGDRQRVGQVLINFLSNAIKYSPQAKKVIITMYEEKRFVRISVQDFGIGIAKKHHKKIFSRFYRATDEQRGAFPGLGIGLYITFEIIRRHEGRVWVESTEGKGSVFTFTLPVANRSKGTMFV